jgi:hypothetical protein
VWRLLAQAEAERDMIARACADYASWGEPSPHWDDAQAALDLLSRTVAALREVLMEQAPERSSALALSS